MLGSNGIGKSSLLQALVGLRKPDKGEIEFVNYRYLHERDFTSAAKRAIGYVPQFDEPLPGLTVFESVMYAGWLKGLSGADLRKATDTAIEVGRCVDFKTLKASRLSGGQLRRLSIAQAIVNAPKVLVLDEPTASLDPFEQDRLKQLLVRLKSRSAVIFSTHNLRDLPGLADRIVFLKDGKASIFASIAEFCGLADEGKNPSVEALQAAYTRAMAGD